MHPLCETLNYLVKDINSLEMVQRRAVRWVTSNYDWKSGISISSTLNRMGYACTEKTNIKAEIIIQSSTSLIRFKTSIQSTRSYHPLHYLPPLILIRINLVFFPRTIVDWNLLPHHLKGGSEQFPQVLCNLFTLVVNFDYNHCG